MDRIPLEILRQVAAWLPYDSVSSFSRVSRAARAAAHDWQTYRAITDGPNHKELRESSEQSVSDTQLEWSRNPITASTPLSECMLYAKADKNCWTITSKDYKLPDLDPAAIRDFVRWAGVMAARAHACVQRTLHTHLHVRYLRSLDESRNVPLAQRYIFSFWVTVCLLSSPVISSTRGSSGIRHIGEEAEEEVRYSLLLESLEAAQRELQERWGELNRSFVARYRYAITITLEYLSEHTPEDRDPNHLGDPEYTFALLLHELCVRSVGLVAYTYKLSRILRRQNTLPKDQAGLDLRHFKPCPLGTEIPFESFMNLPLPFKHEPIDFLTCHLKKMTSREFLEEGLWMGIEGDERLLYFDPAMIDVKLTLISREVQTNGNLSLAEGDRLEQGNEHATWVLGGRNGMKYPVLRGSGIDKRGPFDLYGRLSLPTARIKLTKTYRSDKLKIYWTCYMTPFGIFGRWSSRHTRADSGYIWLWKEDWCSDSRQTQTDIDMQDVDP
ncbi:hypothetical protein TWF730_009336 [Orbilia blumenaviensis]|uniref:F-box domain-containing protein n=1 Tax=Orbilia blumenaviensis TaxID=1796055 RepID=A0AAV9V1B6_9PEZI